MTQHINIRVKKTTFSVRISAFGVAFYIKLSQKSQYVVKIFVQFVLLAYFRKTVLVGGGKHAVAIGTSFETTQSKAKLSHAEVGFEDIQIGGVELGFVASNGIQMYLAELGNAKISVGFVGVVVRQVEVGHASLQAKLSG